MSLLATLFSLTSSVSDFPRIWKRIFVTNKLLLTVYSFVHSSIYLTRVGMSPSHFPVLYSYFTNRNTICLNVHNSFVSFFSISLINTTSNLICTFYQGVFYLLQILFIQCIWLILTILQRLFNRVLQVHHGWEPNPEWYQSILTDQNQFPQKPLLFFHDIKRTSCLSCQLWIQWPTK